MGVYIQIDPLKITIESFCIIDSISKNVYILLSHSLKGGWGPTEACVVNLSEIESCYQGCNWTDTCLSVHCTIGCGNTGGGK